MTKKKTTTRRALAEPSASLVEKKWFMADPEPLPDPIDKNDRLSDLLTTTWNDLNIVSIRRIEIGASGWEATYRE